MKVYLISPKTLKQKSLINDNTLDKFIVPAIDAAQNINLKQIIGKFLLDKLLMLCSTEDEQSSNPSLRERRDADGSRGGQC